MSFTISKIRILLMTVAVLAQSCQYFEKKQSKEILLQKELKSINWQDVDEYPSIADCDILDLKEQQRQCFFEYLTANVQKKLDSMLPIQHLRKVDSLMLKIFVLPDSQVVYDLNSDDLKMKKNLDSIFLLKTFQFQNLQPALKRGIPVKIQFEIPVKINLN